MKMDREQGTYVSNSVAGLDTMASRINRPDLSNLTRTGLLPDEMPDIYAMGCAGDCLLPVFKDGCFLKFSKSEPYEVGDFVVLYKRPELVRPGGFQAIIKRLVNKPAAWVTFPWKNHPNSDAHPAVMVAQLNPPRTFAVPCDHLLGIHKCLGEVGRHETRVRMTDDEIRREAAADRAKASRPRSRAKRSAEMVVG